MLICPSRPKKSVQNDKMYKTKNCAKPEIMQKHFGFAHFVGGGQKVCKTKKCTKPNIVQKLFYFVRSDYLAIKY